MSQHVAETVLAALSDHRQVPLFTASPSGLTLTEAYTVTPRLRAAFEARGETITGRKIGFTNREMWQVYGVHAPIWGYCTNCTTFEIADAPMPNAFDFAEPRMEPEIMFGLQAAPDPGMSDSELLDCIDWISLGFEIVQSIYPGWQFAAPDTVAANALHGALFVGSRHRIAPRRDDWSRELAAFRVDLLCDGQHSQSGGGELVLGSPLMALRHLVGLLAEDPKNPPLSAGEIVSTGSLTLAMPITPGQTWTAKPEGIPLEEVTLRIAS